MKLLLSTFLIGALLTGGISAGEYCATSAKDKCVIDPCPTSKGKVSFGYETDYIFHGVRLARDTVWADVNYTLKDLAPVPVTFGVFHLTSLGSGNVNGNDAFGDQTVVYGKVDMAGFMGFKTSLGYMHYFFPTNRTPAGAGPRIGDSMGEAWLKISRELPMGITAAYKRTYNYDAPKSYANQAAGGLTNNTTDEGAWIHELSFSKSICLTDCISLGLCGGVIYTDNFWPADTTSLVDGALDRNSSTGWNNYYLRADLPIKLNSCATLVPYVGYNGSPDSWIADGVNTRIPGGNANDIFHGGVSIRVDF